MMKRILLFLLAMLLMLPAHAEETASSAEPFNAVYLLVLRTEQGDIACGTGVLYGDSHTLLTTVSGFSGGELYAVGADGRHRILYEGSIAGSPVTLMGMEGDSPASPLHIAASGTLLMDLVLGVDRQGEPQFHPITNVRNTRIGGHDGVLLTAAEGLLPGAVMLGADGGIACMVASQHGEGRGSYTALTNTALSALLTDGDTPVERIDYAPGLTHQPDTTPAAAPDVLIKPGVTAGGLVCGIEASIENGLLTVDWSTAVPDEMPGEFTAYLLTGMNPYLNYATVSGTKAQFLVLPETEVAVWVSYSEEPQTTPIYPSYAPGTILTLTTQEAESFTRFGFTNHHISLTPCADTASGILDQPLPVVPITREVLSERSVPVYFQTWDTYQVEEESVDHPLLVALYTPEGYTFTYESTYYFSPDLAGGDMWAEDLSPMLANYEKFVPEAERWPDGTYLVLYCIDGQVAGEFTFELGK